MTSQWAQPFLKEQLKKKYFSPSGGPEYHRPSYQPLLMCRRYASAHTLIEHLCSKVGCEGTFIKPRPIPKKFKYKWRLKYQQHASTWSYI